MARAPQDRPARKRTAGLTAEDSELWDKVARTARPLAGRKPATGKPPAQKSPGTGQPHKSDSVPAKAKPDIPPAPSARAKPAGPPAVPLAELDRRLVQKLARGRAGVEASIDLHGLKQAEAEQQLFSFIQRCQARDLRMVLVITGKGRARETGWSLMDGPEPGVLKRAVPLWLGQARFRPMVVGYREAARHHGGAGALYVQLRRR